MPEKTCTPAQKHYLRILLQNCDERGIEVPVETEEEIEDGDMTVERASEIIEGLKFELGWRE